MATCRHRNIKKGREVKEERKKETRHLKKNYVLYIIEAKPVPVPRFAGCIDSADRVFASLHARSAEQRA